MHEMMMWKDEERSPSTNVMLPQIHSTTGDMCVTEKGKGCSREETEKGNRKTQQRSTCG